MRKKFRSNDRKEAIRYRLKPSDYLSSAAKALLVPLVLIPLLFTSGKLQPFFNFFLIGYALSSFSRTRKTLVFEIPVSCAVAFLVWPRIFNLDFYLKTIQINDPLIYGDVIVNSVFVDLILSSLNFDFFYPSITSASLIYCLIAVAIGIFFYELVSNLVVTLKLKDRLPETFIASAIIVLILISNAYFSAYGINREKINQPVIYGQYATDYHIYKRAFELMKNEGEGYYRALYLARAGDARVIVNQNDYPIPSPLWVRQPYLFYFWKAISFPGTDALMLFALLLFSLGYLLLSYALEIRYFKGASLLALSLIYPFYYLLIGWESVFLPDTWGSIFALISAGFLLVKKDIGSLLSSQAASLSRNLFSLWFFILLVYLTSKSILEKNASKLKKILIASVVFPLLYLLHIYNTLYRHPYIFTVENPAISTGTRFVLDPSLNLKNIFWISNFLTYPYTMHLFHGAALIAVLAVVYATRWFFWPRKLSEEDVLAATAFAYTLLFAASSHVSQYYNATLFVFLIISLTTLLATLISGLNRKID